jgi:hypothetical protein
MTPEQIKARLEYLRGEINAERISYGELFELQSLAEYIDPGDVLLLEWAGVPESREASRSRRAIRQAEEWTAKEILEREG